MDSNKVKLLKSKPAGRKPSRKVVIISRLLLALLGVAITTLGFILTSNWIVTGRGALWPIGLIVAFVGIVLFWCALAPSSATVGQGLVGIVSQLLADLFS